MPAYVVSMMSITDAEVYKQYTQRTPPMNYLLLQEGSTNTEDPDPKL